MAKLSLTTIYRRAADVIQKNGHSIGNLKDDKGHMCLYGAINFIVNRDPYRCTTETSQMLEPLRPFTKGENPVSWNNAPGRTKRQVVNMLRRAAAKLAA